MLKLVSTKRSSSSSFGGFFLKNKLRVATKSHTQDMVDNNFFSHIDSDKLALIVCVKRVNYK